MTGRRGEVARSRNGVLWRGRNRVGYRRPYHVQVYMPQVLWEAVKQQARREHRTASGWLAVQAEKALGWADTRTRSSGPRKDGTCDSLIKSPIQPPPKRED